MTRKRPVTLERVRELFSYEQATGDLVWIKRTSNRIKVGDAVKTKHSEGYVFVGIDGEHYLAHHIIWLWMTGERPSEIDHRDGCRSNNRWNNLRGATRSQNNYNATLRSDNTSGRKGVWWHRQRSKWSAQIHADGRKYHLGLFHSKEEAYRAYIEASEILHGDFSRT